MTSWQIFWCDDVFLTSWRTFWSNDEPFVLMTYFDIITNILKSGQTDFLKSWWVYEIITNLWRHNKHNVSNVFDVMEVFDDVTQYLMPWHTFDVMTNFLTSWCVLYLEANFLLSWRISWPAYIVLWHFLFHHFGHKILRKRVFDVIVIMICKRLTSWQT